jgi:hypothetical protein
MKVLGIRCKINLGMYPKRFIDGSSELKYFGILKWLILNPFVK